MKFDKKRYQAQLRRRAEEYRTQTHYSTYAALGHMLSQEQYQTLFQAQLLRIYACAEARLWVGNKTAREAWNACERADWMRFLANSFYVPYELVYGNNEDEASSPDSIRKRVPFELLREYSQKY